MADTYDLSDIKIASPSPVKPGDEVTPPISENEILKEIELQDKYGSSELSAAALGAADAATLGLSSQALAKTGLVSSEAQKEIAERNPLSHAAGEVGGFVAPIALAPGAGLAKGAVEAAAEFAPVNLITKAGDAAAKLVEGTGRSSIARKIAAQAAKGGVEGGAFGVGNLMSENALGNADFNGENLAASVGVGAALGGGLGGLIGAASSAKPAIGRGTSALREKISDYRGKTALDYTGLTEKQISKLEAVHPDLKEVLPEIMDKAGITVTSSAKEDLQKLASYKESTGVKIGEAMNKADAHIAETMPEVLPLSRELYTPLLEDLNKKYIVPNALLPTMKSDVAPIKVLMEEFSGLAANNQPTTLKELFTHMQRMSDKAKYDKNPGQIRLVDSAYRDVRNYLRQAIDSTVDKVSASQPELSSLAAELKQANKEYSVLSSVVKNFKSDKQQSALDQVMSLIAPMKALKSAIVDRYGKKMIIFSDIKKVGEAVENRLGEGFTNFAKKTMKSTRPLSTKVLMNSYLSSNHITDKGTKAKDRAQAYTNVKNNLQALADNPDEMMNKIAKSTAAFHDQVPNIAESTQATLVKGIQFLQSKIPTSPSDGQLDGTTMFQKPYQPSNIELAKFERYLQAVESPLSTLDDLENGTLTREHVEALQAVYPQIYDRMREMAVQKTTEDKEHVISYNKRIQLGTLLNIDTDPSLLPQNIAGLQSMFAGQNEPTQPQQGGTKPAIRPNAKGASEIDIASRSNTGMQSVATKHTNA